MGNEESSFLRLKEGQICDPQWGVWVALGCPVTPGGPTMAPKDACLGAVCMGLGRGRGAHLHLGPAVLLLGSVTNCMSPRPDHSPCPAPSSVTSCRHLCRSVCAPSQSRPSVCPPHAGRSPAVAGDQAGPRVPEWRGRRPWTRQAEGRECSKRAIRAPRTCSCVRSRPGAAAASAAWAGVEAESAPQRGWDQG